MLNAERQNDTALSSEDLLKHMQSLEKRIRSLEVLNIVTLGLFVGTLAAAVMVGAGFAVAAAPIIAGSTVGGILTTVAFVALSVTLYKCRAEIKAVLKYAAGRIKASAFEGYENSVNLLKRGAGIVNKRTKEKVSDMAYLAAGALYRAAGKEDYLDKMTRFTSEMIKKSDEIKNDVKEIFADKVNNTAGLVKDILSGIASRIDLKIAEEAKSGWMEYTPEWQAQKEFISNLDEKSLLGLLTQRSLPKGSYFLNSVFSEHYDEVKEVIKECKENHLYSSISSMFNIAEKKANRSSLFHLPKRKSPKQSDNSTSLMTGGSNDSSPVVQPEVPASSATSGYNSSEKRSPISSGFATPVGGQTPPLKRKFDEELMEKLEKKRSSVDQLIVEPASLRVEVPETGN